MIIKARRSFGFENPSKPPHTWNESYLVYPVLREGNTEIYFAKNAYRNVLATVESGTWTNDFELPLIFDATFRDRNKKLCSLLKEAERMIAGVDWNLHPPINK